MDEPREGKRSVGRPRGFCEEGALDRAMEVFWRKGYEGTTLPDLTSAMGVNKPSLYATFGNKEALFRRVVERYVELRGRGILEALARPSAREAAEAMLRRLIEEAPDGPPGCLLVQGALVCSAEADSIRVELASLRARTECLMRDRFEAAAATGELASAEEAADLARYFTTLVEGMVVRSLSGASPDELGRVVDTAMRAWPDREPPARPRSGRRK